MPIDQVDKFLSLHVDETVKQVLLKVADELVPLQKWIETKKFNPINVNQEKNLPWRDQNASLNFEKLNLVSFLINLIRETAYEIPLFEHWNRLENEPFKYSPIIRDHNSWRKSRFLEEDAIFGGLESRNLRADKEGNIIVRLDFYKNCISHLMEVYKDNVPQNPKEWEDFVTKLWENKFPSWDSTKTPSPQSFLVQYTRDILYCAMGMRGNVNEPYSTALLIELGETRRVGNHFTVDDTEEAVENFKRILNQYREGRK